MTILAYQDMRQLCYKLLVDDVRHSDVVLRIIARLSHCREYLLVVVEIFVKKMRGQDNAGSVCVFSKVSSTMIFREGHLTI